MMWNPYGSSWNVEVGEGFRARDLGVGVLWEESTEKPRVQETEPSN
jgi:hypothetical protein